MTVLHQKLLQGDGWSQEKRPRIVVTTSFRPCLVCALLVAGYSQVSSKLVGDKILFSSPPADANDTSLWYMPKLQDTEQQEILIDAFDYECMGQNAFWALDKEDLEMEARRAEMRTIIVQPKSEDSEDEVSTEEDIDSSILDDEESDNEESDDDAYDWVSRIELAFASR